MEALYLELRADNPDSKVHDFILFNICCLVWSLVNQFSTVCATFQVKLTTIHPFTVDTGLAKKPRSRLKLILIKDIRIANPLNSLSCLITYCFFVFYLRTKLKLFHPDLI